MSRTDLEHLHDALLHFDIAVDYIGGITKSRVLHFARVISVRDLTIKVEKWNPCITR